VKDEASGSLVVVGREKNIDEQLIFGLNDERNGRREEEGNFESLESGVIKNVEGVSGRRALIKFDDGRERIGFGILSVESEYAQVVGPGIGEEFFLDKRGDFPEEKGKSDGLAHFNGVLRKEPREGIASINGADDGVGIWSGLRFFSELESRAMEVGVLASGVREKESGEGELGVSEQ